MNETNSKNQVHQISKRVAFNLVKKLYLRNGYLRKKDELKLKVLGAQKYKKGYEVRLVPKDEQELSELRAAISALEITVAKTFIKNVQIVQPIYSREIYEKLQKINKEPKK